MIVRRRFFSHLLALIVASCATSFATALPLAPTTAGCCGQRMTIAGDARYYAPKDAKTPTGIALPEGFTSEIYGKMLVLTAELPKGAYTVQVEASENSYTQEAQRYFDVIVNNTPIARAVDLYKLAGGEGKPYTISGTIDHPGGPLKVILMARADNAKFSIIHILDAQGNKVAWALSDDMKDIAKDETPPPIPEVELWRDTSLPMEFRAAKLVSQMTLREKINQMMFQAPAIERLNIPTYNYWNECLHGVARNGHATVFPQAIGMAASFDTDLLHTVADTISAEARAKHEESAHAGQRGIYQGLNFWTPNINIFRDPRWGRGQETYGEDPFLTSRMGVAFITGLQGTDPTYFKVIATAKHFAVHSGPESLRHVFNVSPSDLDFHETYLPQFEAAVKEAHVYSVMGAYNRVYDAPATASTLLLQDILHKQWGFNGFIVSDCGAIDDIWANHKVVSNRAEAAAAAVKAGTDLECGSDYSALLAAVDLKLITEKEIDSAVTRIMLARFRLGMFDPPAKVPYSKIAPTDYDTPAHADIALKMSRESIVLLKNDNNTLPLKKHLKKIAIVGPNAEALLPLLGNYNGTPTRITTIADGIRAASPDTEIVSIRGCDIAPRPGSFQLAPDTVFRFNNKPGLHAQYFATEDLDASGAKPLLERQDQTIDFNGSIEGFIPHLPPTKGSIRWTGEFVAPATGKYRLIMAAPPAGAPQGHRVWINNKLVDSRWDNEAGNMLDPLVELQAGQAVPLKIECHHSTSFLGMALFWDHTDADVIPQVLDQVKNADAIIFVSGLDGRIEAEEGDVRGVFTNFSGGDRDTIELPSTQENLLKALATTNIPIIMVNMTGSAIAMPWEAKNIPAILQAWYPGQSGGIAVADILFGNTNPSGKLPITFYQSTADLPPFTDYNMQTPPGRTYRYFTGKPLFPFGHGLSYTQFHYGKLTITPDPANTSATASLELTNTGPRDGDEVIQLYARSSLPNEPARKLVAFKRISIPAGKTLSALIPIRFQDLQIWDTNAKSYKLPPGPCIIDAGSSSADIRSTQQFTVNK